MTVRELIRQLQNFDGELSIEVKAECDCGFAMAGNTVDSVTFEDGKCVLFSYE